MSHQQLGGNDVHVSIGDYLAKFESVSLTLTDNSQAAMNRGKPDGWIRGDVSAEGSIEVDNDALDVIVNYAQNSGSFQEMPPFDISFVAAVPNRQLSVTAFGCKLKIEDLIDAQNNSADKLKHKIGFFVTDDDFVHINGVPYAARDPF